MGEVSLLQNDHGVPDMPVQKMYPHCRPRCCLSWSSLNWAAQQDSLGREDHAVCTLLFHCGRGCATPYLLCHLNMLCLNVTCHRSSLYLLPELPALHPSLLSLPVGRSLSHHQLNVRRHRLGTRRLAWAADHVKCIPGISPQAHSIEQANQGTKCTLELLWVRRCNHVIFHIEEGILMPTLL